MKENTNYAQTLKSYRKQQTTQLAFAEELGISAIHYTPVSYTHLDVYKKQLLRCFIIIRSDSQNSIYPNFRSRGSLLGCF